MQHRSQGREAAAQRILMAELDEVLARSENQLNKMKKSLRSRNRELAEVTISTSETKKSPHCAQKNLHGTPRESPAEPQHSPNGRPQR
jgi:uncharacterized coiled-coil protein SlyX